MMEELPTISRLLNAEDLHADPLFTPPPGTPVASTIGGELFLMINVDAKAERERLTKEIAKLEEEVRTVDGKLKNKLFLDRAPAAVVEEHRQRKKAFSEQLAKVKSAREKLGL